MAEFDGQVFAERGSGGQRFPSHSASTLGSLVRIPGGSRVVLQQSSAKDYELKTTAKTDYAGYLALVGKVGTSGALILGGQTGTGTLIEVGAATEIHISDVFFVDLTFSLVSGAMTDSPEAAGGYGFDFGGTFD